MMLSHYIYGGGKKRDKTETQEKVDTYENLPEAYPTFKNRICPPLFNLFWQISSIF